MKSNYYISSFFWSTLSKILTAIVNFFSIPLLLGIWGKADYGILSLATACNGYMHLLDLGMNTGAVRFYSQWILEGKMDTVYKVAHSNTVFYLLISFVNIFGLIVIAVWGESLFNITHEQFLVLRTCLFILAIFSIPTWITTSYNQLLVANKQMAYTQQMQCISTLLKAALVMVTLVFHLSLPVYFFFFTLAVALLLLPYAVECKRKRLIDSFRFTFHWNDFKVVLFYSLSLFVLSVFQMTATQSRPLILGIFADSAADVAAEYRIVEVIPLFIITVGGTLTGILLPKSSELVAKGRQDEIERFAYRGTVASTILTNVLCMPFMLGAKEILSAYVGVEYGYLSVWLIVWCVTVLFQIHTTPGNSLILAYGKTKLLVYTSACACVISMVINALLCRYYGVGSAVIGYFIYVLIVIGSYYVAYYRRLLHLSCGRMFASFLLPTVLSLAAFALVCFIPYDSFSFPAIHNERFYYLFLFALKALTWLLVYALLLRGFKIITVKGRQITLY